MIPEKQRNKNNHILAMCYNIKLDIFIGFDQLMRAINSKKPMLSTSLSCVSLLQQFHLSFSPDIASHDFPRWNACCVLSGCWCAFLGGKFTWHEICGFELCRLGAKESWKWERKLMFPENKSHRLWFQNDFGKYAGKCTGKKRHQ